jgi:hypothetical protein
MEVSIKLLLHNNVDNLALKIKWFLFLARTEGSIGHLACKSYIFLFKSLILAAS